MQWLVIFAAVLGAESDEQKAAKPDPISAYEQRDIRGWDVFVHKSLLQEEKED